MTFKEQVVHASVRFHPHARGTTLAWVGDKGTPTLHVSLVRPVEAGFSLPALEYFHSEGFISKLGLSVTVETVGGQDASADEDHAMPSIPKLSPAPQQHDAVGRGNHFTETVTK